MLCALLRSVFNLSLLAALVGLIGLAPAGLLFRVREAFFRERAMTQAMLAMAFCLMAHGLWVTSQALLGAGEMAWSTYGRTLLQAVGVSGYTALLMPLVHFGLVKCRRWFLASSAGRRGRAGR